jgi:hypothetical protein
MSELDLSQINAKVDAILTLVMKLRAESKGYSVEIEGLVSHKYKLEAALKISELARDRALEENKKLRRAIYNAVDHNTDRLERSFLQGIIAEFEPNHVT